MSEKTATPFVHVVQRAGITASKQICPSAPIFQNFILKASVTPSAVTHKGMAIFTVSRKAMLLPSAPDTMVP